MREEAMQAIQEAITAWRNNRVFTFENKRITHYKSPITDGEYMLIFSNTVNSFFCDKQQMEISLSTRPFHTATLSKNPLSDNPKGDKYRLEKFLEEFDKEFYALVENKLSECIENLTTSDPLFF
jgi:hypothetical protein